jgi:hypothetical protein
MRVIPFLLISQKLYPKGGGKNYPRIEKQDQKHLIPHSLFLVNICKAITVCKYKYMRAFLIRSGRCSVDLSFSLSRIRNSSLKTKRTSMAKRLKYAV